MHKYVLLRIITQYTQASDKLVGKLLPGVCFVAGAKMGEICVLRVSCRHRHLVEQKAQTGLEAKKNVGISAQQSESLTSPLSYLSLCDVVCS